MVEWLLISDRRLITTDAPLATSNVKVLKHLPMTGGVTGHVVTAVYGFLGSYDIAENAPEWGYRLHH